MEVHSGFLSVKLSGLLKAKSFPNHWCMLFSGRGKWSPRIDLFVNKETIRQADDEKSETKEPTLSPNCKKSIFLEDVTWVDSNCLGPGFTLEIKGKNITFVASSESERKHWVMALCCISGELFDSKHIIYAEMGMKADNKDFYVEENVLYETSDVASKSFVVMPDDAEGCHQLKLRGPLKLVVGEKRLDLLRYDNEQSIADWEYCTVRDFGHSKHAFFLTAGSRSSTGQGYFMFHTTQGEQIIMTISLNTNRLKVKSTPTSSDSVVSCNSHPPQPLTRPKPPLRISTSHESERNVPPPTPTKPKSSISKTSDSSNAFKDQLNKTIGSVVSPPRKDSVGSMISVNSSSKTSSKAEKKLEKKLKEDQKKQEKQRKKEEKEIEEKRKKEEKEQEEKRKKELKAKKKQDKSDKGKPKVEAPPEILQNSIYSEPEYASTDICVNKVSSASALASSVEYSDPWENRPILPTSTINNNNVNKEYVDDQPEEMYAQAAIVPGRIRKSVTEEYEDVESDYSAPPVIPPKKFEEAEEVDDVNVYEHLNQAINPHVPPPENVYGMASGRVLEKPVENVYEQSKYPLRAKGLECTYEDVG